ncbi:MAG: hypothetical protein P4M05_35545 [Bradyrhizobium sp.]|nr:hypothetical protein [Bradyrhizobium sp.]
MTILFVYLALTTIVLPFCLIVFPVLHIRMVGGGRQIPSAVGDDSRIGMEDRNPEQPSRASVSTPTNGCSGLRRGFFPTAYIPECL